MVDMLLNISGFSRKPSSNRRVLLLAGLVSMGVMACSTAQAAVIIEFRLRGPSGANDEFIRIYNEASTAVTVNAVAGTGWAVAASDGVTRCTIPNGTIIPVGGSFLCANSSGYSLSAAATADVTYTGDIPDNAGIALFNNNLGGPSFTLANRLDAVGSTSESNSLYKEGAGYGSLTPFSIDSSFTRDLCGKGGSIIASSACSSAGAPRDTGDNAADFVFVDTNGTSAGAGQRLGAPGPANSASPVLMGGALTSAPLDSCQAASASPNWNRELTSDPANNSTFGTLRILRRFTNTSGAPLTQLRFRVMDLTTFPAPSGYADLRPRTSGNVAVTINGSACGGVDSSVTAYGAELEMPPSQPNGGGFNSTLSVQQVSLATPLAAGASIDVNFLFGIQQAGIARLGLVAEGTPVGGGTFEVLGCTEAASCMPMVSSITQVGSGPISSPTAAFTVTFEQSVIGVDVNDFQIISTGISGAQVTSSSGSGTTYTVTVNTGTGNGTLALKLVDNGSIKNAQNMGLMAGAGGDFTSANFTVTKTPPAPIPTMTEWAMLLFGGLLAAGAAALAGQRRRQAA
jgi:hypothetical protein